MKDDSDHAMRPAGAAASTFGEDTTFPPRSIERRRRRGPRWPRAALRITSAVQAALVFTQAVLAGHLLTGNTAARAAHQALGTEVIPSVALLQIVFAVLLWRPGRGPAWPIAVTIVAFLAVGAQIGMGFNGQLAVHIPLGVTILAVNLAMALGLRAPARTA